MSAPSLTDDAPKGRRALARRLLALYTVGFMIYTLVPIAVMIAFSFNKAPIGRVSLKWLGFTTKWYWNAFSVQDLTTAMLHSLEVGFTTMFASVVLATPLAIALARYRFRGKAVSDIVIFADIAAPAVVVGASLLSLFLSMNWPRGLFTIMIAHIAFGVAFAVVVIRARVSVLDSALDRAAADLGATPWVAFWTVTFPLILPGIVGAGLLAFALSIDDLIITSFVAGQTLTFPLWVYGAVKTGMPPQVFVLSTLIFVGGAFIAVVNSVIAHRNAN